MESAAEKNLDTVLEQTQPLARLMRAQRLFEALDRAIQPSLSETCRGQLRVACVEGDTLVLAAASSAWASRARLEAQSALDAAGRLWPSPLKKVRVIVSPWTDAQG